MDGKGKDNEFFDVDFNHPIDSAAIQNGVASLKQTRQQHMKWQEVSDKGVCAAQSKLIIDLRRTPKSDHK